MSELAGVAPHDKAPLRHIERLKAKHGVDYDSPAATGSWNDDERPDRRAGTEDRIAMISDEDAYNELCAYTLDHALGDPAFIHQHVVDAHAAQRADEHSKPIGITFALVGLYLHVEKQFSGRRVQRVHMELARSKRQWPTFALPVDRGATTAADVVAAPAGPARDRAIDDWCASVWTAYAVHRQTIIDLLTKYGILP